MAQGDLLVDGDGNLVTLENGIIASEGTYFGEADHYCCVYLALDCETDTPAGYVMWQHDPVLDPTKVHRNIDTEVCVYWIEADDPDPPCTPLAEVEDFDEFDDCADCVVEYCYVCYEVTWVCDSPTTGHILDPPGLVVIGQSCTNVFGIGIGEGWVLWDSDATTCTFRRVIREMLCVDAPGGPDCEDPAVQETDPGLPDNLDLSECPPCPGSTR